MYHYKYNYQENYLDYDGHYFPERFCEILPGISLSDSRRFFKIIRTSAYGPPEGFTENQNQKQKRDDGDFVFRIRAKF